MLVCFSGGITPQFVLVVVSILNQGEEDIACVFEPYWVVVGDFSQSVFYCSNGIFGEDSVGIFCVNGRIITYFCLELYEMGGITWMRGEGAVWSYFLRRNWTRKAAVVPICVDVMLYGEVP